MRFRKDDSDVKSSLKMRSFHSALTHKQTELQILKSQLWIKKDILYLQQEVGPVIWWYLVLQNIKSLFTAPLCYNCNNFILADMGHMLSKSFLLKLPASKDQELNSTDLSQKNQIEYQQQDA